MHLPIHIWTFVEGSKYVLPYKIKLYHPKKFTLFMRRKQEVPQFLYPCQTIFITPQIWNPNEFTSKTSMNNHNGRKKREKGWAYSNEHIHITSKKKIVLVSISGHRMELMSVTPFFHSPPNVFLALSPNLSWSFFTWWSEQTFISEGFHS